MWTIRLIQNHASAELYRGSGLCDGCIPTCHVLSPVELVKPTQARPRLSLRVLSRSSGVMNTGLNRSSIHTVSVPAPTPQSACPPWRNRNKNNGHHAGL
jgi:hypothetical protein